MEHGEIVSWTHEEYNAERERVRSTGLKHFTSAQGPRSYFWNVLNPEEAPEKRTADIKIGPKELGTIAHEFILEGQRNWKTLDGRRGTNKAKDLADEFPDMWLLSAEQEKVVIGMRDGAYRNPKFKAAMEGSRSVEQTILFPGPGGIPSKVRLDINARRPIEGILDIKTSMATTRDEFQKEIRRLHYDFSAAMYKYGLQTLKGMEREYVPFYHVMISKKRPYWTYVWELDFESYIKVGEEMMIRSYAAMDAVVKRCAAEGVAWDSMEALPFWPDYTEESQDTPNTAPPIYVPGPFLPDNPMGEVEGGLYG